MRSGKPTVLQGLVKQIDSPDPGSEAILDEQWSIVQFNSWLANRARFQAKPKTPEHSGFLIDSASLTQDLRTKDWHFSMEVSGRKTVATILDKEGFSATEIATTSVLRTRR